MEYTKFWTEKIKKMYHMRELSTGVHKFSQNLKVTSKF